METTATYNQSAGTITINTPSTLAQKYWITNGAVHAHHCVVFAQLIVEGTNQGIHAILVPIRDKDLNPMPGVTIEDMGHKMVRKNYDWYTELTFFLIPPIRKLMSLLCGIIWSILFS